MLSNLLASSLNPDSLRVCKIILSHVSKLITFQYTHTDIPGRHLQVLVAEESCEVSVVLSQDHFYFKTFDLGVNDHSCNSLSTMRLRCDFLRRSHLWLAVQLKFL